MNIFHVLLLTLALGHCMPSLAYAQQTLTIAAVVNDEAISMADVDDRIRLVLISSGIPDSKEIRKKIMPQVIDGLVEEQLKLQEARRNKLDVTEEEVMDGLKIIAEQNKFSPEQFLEMMKKAGVPEKTLKRQIRAQLSWNKVIKEVYRKQVDVSEVDVNTRIERMKAKVGQTEYLVAEIFLPFDDTKRSAELQQFAQQLAQELQAKKAPFGAVAAQFSKAAGAEKGGLIGWVQEGQLEPELEKTFMALQEGEVSNPVRTQRGIYILTVQKRRTLNEESIPPRDELRNMIGFERLDRVQQRALLDLKSAAFIDRRI